MIGRGSMRKLLIGVEHIGLLIVVLATMVALGQEIWVMIDAKLVKLSDLLLMFIYLEVITMIGIYYEKNKLPVRYPIYIAITALSRYIILDTKNLTAWTILELCISILVLTIAVLVLRIGSKKYPYENDKSS